MRLITGKPAKVTIVHSPESDTELWFLGFFKVIDDFPVWPAHSTPHTRGPWASFYLSSQQRGSIKFLWWGRYNTNSAFILSPKSWLYFIRPTISQPIPPAAHVREQLSAKVVRGKTLRGKWTPGWVEIGDWALRLTHTIVHCEEDGRASDLHVHAPCSHQIPSSLGYGNLSRADDYQSPVDSMTQCVWNSEGVSYSNWKANSSRFFSNTLIKKVSQTTTV